MRDKRPEFLGLENHQKVHRILSRYAGEVDLSWLKEPANEISKRWFRLAQQHLRAAEHLSGSRRQWRSMLSRCYYAIYNSSKSVRYCSEGCVKDNHQEVGDLPKDFPERSQWSSFATDLRRDRNIADYEPWHDVRRNIIHEPDDALRLTRQFLRLCRDYLRQRGVRL